MERRERTTNETSRERRLLSTWMRIHTQFNTKRDPVEIFMLFPRENGEKREDNQRN